MTEAERFAVILDELGSLLAKLGWFCDRVVLIGGQALAVEQVAAGEGPVLQVQTDTGQIIERGFSFDPDLLIEPADPAESSQWDQLPHVLRESGYRRSNRSHQWEKQIGEVYVRLDLFMPVESLEPPTPMTPLPRGDRVLARAKELVLRLRDRDVNIRTPSIVDFVLMKLDATHIRRPRSSKDAFDLYAYVRKKGPGVVGAAIAAAPERDEALDLLQELFERPGSVGVLDVLSFAPTLAGPDKELVEKDVLRTFAELRRAALSESTPGTSSSPS